MAEPNYLLGKGERLVNDLTLPQGGGGKPLPFDFDTAKTRLSSRFKKIAKDLSSLPDSACPNDEAVAAITIHPGQIAKSYFPGTLLSTVGLRTVGSHPTTALAKNGTEEEMQATTELYVAAPRKTFERLSVAIDRWKESDPWADDLRRLSDARVVPPAQRIKPIHSTDPIVLCEVVLHGAGESATAPAVLSSFADFMRSLGLDVDVTERVDTASLSFVAATIPQDRLNEVAEFGFLRTVRMMPKLRELEPGTTAESKLRRSPVRTLYRLTACPAD